MSERWPQGLGTQVLPLSNRGHVCVDTLGHSRPAADASESRLMWVKDLAHLALGCCFFLIPSSTLLFSSFCKMRWFHSKISTNASHSKSLCFKCRHSGLGKLYASITSKFPAFWSWFGPQDRWFPYSLEFNNTASEFRMCHHWYLLLSMTWGQVT